MRSKAGVALFAAVFIIWCAFVVLLVVTPMTLAELWWGFGNLPVLLRAVLGVVFLPWVLGLAAWFAQWPEWLRIVAVGVLAIASFTATYPRRYAAEVAADRGATPEQATAEHPTPQDPTSAT